MKAAVMIAIALGALLAVGIAVAVSTHADPTGTDTSIKGEVVDLWCFLESGARGAGHKACAVGCATSGLPIGIVDADGNIYLALGFKDHQSAKDLLLSRMADTVTVSGTLVKKGGFEAIFIKEVK